MLNVRFLFIALIFFPISAPISVFSSPNEIVAVVNDSPITIYELNQRKSLLKLLNNINKNLSEAEEKFLAKDALNDLINEKIILGERDKFGINVSNDDINQTIEQVEKNNKFPKDFFTNELKEKNLDYDAFKRKIESEIVKNRIAMMISKTLAITKSEVDTTIVNSNFKDVKVDIKTFSSNDLDSKTYTQMLAFKRKLTTCDRLPVEKVYSNIAELREFSNISINSLPSYLQLSVKALDVGDISNVFKCEDDGSFKIVMLCAKHIENLTDKERSYVLNILGNSKLSVKADTFFENLRKKAYIDYRMKIYN